VFNRASVKVGLGAISRCVSSRLPPNGLAMFAGNDGIIACFEPPRALTKRVYICGSHLELGPLQSMTEAEEPFALVVVDGAGAALTTLQGNACGKLTTLSANVKGRSRRGGQSAPRFGRLRDEAEAAWVKQVAEALNDAFVGDAGTVTVRGLVVGGKAAVKTLLVACPTLNPRLRDMIIGPFEVAQGALASASRGRSLPPALMELIAASEAGRAAMLAAPGSAGAAAFFERIAAETATTCFGLRETLDGLEVGAVETVLVAKDCAAVRLLVEVLRTPASVSSEFSPAHDNSVAAGAGAGAGAGAEAGLVKRQLFEVFVAADVEEAEAAALHALVARLNAANASKKSKKRKGKTKTSHSAKAKTTQRKKHKKARTVYQDVTEESLTIVDRQPVERWLRETADVGGADVVVVTECDANTSSFCSGFGGLGGLLRYRYAPAAEGPQMVVASDCHASTTGDARQAYEVVIRRVRN